MGRNRAADMVFLQMSACANYCSGRLPLALRSFQEPTHQGWGRLLYIGASCSSDIQVHECKVRRTESYFSFPVSWVPVTFWTTSQVTFLEQM